MTDPHVTSIPTGKTIPSGKICDLRHLQRDIATAVHAADLELVQHHARPCATEQSVEGATAVHRGMARPYRTTYDRRRRIGGGRAVRRRHGGGRVGRGGAMAVWWGAGSMAVVLTVVKFLLDRSDLFDFKWQYTDMALGKRLHALLPEHLIQEDLNDDPHVCCVCPCALGRRRAPGRALSSLEMCSDCQLDRTGPVFCPCEQEDDKNIGRPALAALAPTTPVPMARADRVPDPPTRRCGTRKKRLSVLRSKHPRAGPCSFAVTFLRGISAFNKIKGGFLSPT